MYAASDLIPLSALQHYLYCPRQCALIHLEQVWSENAYTAEGRILHEKAHEGGAETRGRVKTVTGLMVRSLELGLSGQCDVVEFHLRDGTWHPYPVEYKRGRPKTSDADRVQLCAQALCLEEMLHLPVPEGALFYGKTRRRETVPLDAALRGSTRRAVEAVHDLFAVGRTPPPPGDAALLCPRCSLREHCMPQARHNAASRYVTSLVETP